MQTRQADEIIVVDDGSTDDTGRLLQEFNGQHGLRVLTFSENRGLCAAINEGLNECRCAWVARIDADDWWDNNHLETLEMSMGTAPENSALVATRARYWNDDNHQIGESSGPLDGNALRCLIMHDNPFVHSAVMFRRDAARQVGGYPNGVRWEDYGLWITLMSTFNALILDTITVNCQKRAGSLSSVDKLLALQGRLKMQRRAWRQFRHCCRVSGSISLAMTWARVCFAAARQRLQY